MHGSRTNPNRRIQPNQRFAAALAIGMALAKQVRQQLSQA
jgi:hypothetical protein